MLTTEIYFDAIKIIDRAIQEHRYETRHPYSITLAEKIAAALSNAQLLREAS